MTGPLLEIRDLAVDFLADEDLFSVDLYMADAQSGEIVRRLASANADPHADALVMAGVAAQAVLVLQANGPPGKLSAELGAGADFHYVVHQASGMVAAQLDVSVGQALIHLRAYAFGNDRPLSEVAEDVVARRLRFGPPSDGQDPGP